MTDVRIGVMFPSTFNLNADVANALVLQRRLELSGVETHIVPITGESSVDDAVVDALVIGSPSSSILLSPDLPRDGIASFVSTAFTSEIPILAISNGFHLLGQISNEDGETNAGLNLIPVTTTFGRTQHVTIGAQLETQWGRVVGVENHNARVELSSGDAFGRIVRGVGNAAGGIDGLCWGTLWATHLHGPVLALNPTLADALCARILDRRGLTFSRGDGLDHLDELANRARTHLEKSTAS